MTPGELPRPREHPLRPGSQKEISFVNYVDSRMLNISRRYAKKFSSDRKKHEGVGKGYDSIDEVVQDLEAVFNVVWVSNTPTLQIPYLLSLASTLLSYLPAFPFSAKSTLRMIRKLDEAFAHLLEQDDSNHLSGLHAQQFHNQGNLRRIVSRTDRVRIRSVCELTRVCITDKSLSPAEDLRDEGSDASSNSSSEDNNGNERMNDLDDEQSQHHDHDMCGHIHHIAQVDQHEDQEIAHKKQGIANAYEKTLELLGAPLASDPLQAQDNDPIMSGSMEVGDSDD
ncbi:hypothetical protein UCRPC4_g04367 [Phaeomoniella chlamydospora]|uniref:Meiotic recombination protein dmc1 n=1 Tax=Phaeomoniella chlamydospora TaxID=158046 RepID=A0A0G2GT39_PHACM|nr:hypothetical protein UCRPC4_g04367 [Phaeomoniella chlamydospora]